jgi:UDP-GlcNAc:undecaprenyl-phosphate/decaprenyl-phosphate GlcNAc-1-phosphate transferase
MVYQIYEYVGVFIMSFLMVYALTPFIIKFALHINFVDKPEARKIHLSAIPLLGGVSVFIGFMMLCIYDVLIAYERTFDKAILGYLGGALLIVIVGVFDDKYGMKPLVKLTGQLSACMLFIFSNFTIAELNMMFGSIFITVPLLILWMVGLMNALNFLDNMDGIISGMAGILALGFFAFSQMNTSVNAGIMGFIGLISLSFSGSVLGFLPYNFNPAKIFLGDAGSMFIGYFLSSMGSLMALYARNQHQSKLFYLLPVLLLSYAIFDISLVSYTRKRDGRHIMQGGKDHSTHRIKTVLGSTKITAIMIYFINLIIVITTMIVFRIGSKPLLVIATFVFAAAFLIFGRKLDNVPIVIPDNQKKAEKPAS